MLFFPEGTRATDMRLQDFKKVPSGMMRPSVMSSQEKQLLCSWKFSCIPPSRLVRKQSCTANNSESTFVVFCILLPGF